MTNGSRRRQRKTNELDDETKTQEIIRIRRKKRQNERRNVGKDKRLKIVEQSKIAADSYSQDSCRKLEGRKRQKEGRKVDKNRKRGSKEGKLEL